MGRLTARALRPIDATRLGQAGARPRNDTRSWCMLGRVVEVGYDGGLVVAVTVVEGALAGEDIVCEVTGALASVNGFCAAAVREGDMVVVVAPDGDANNMGRVVGFEHEPATPPPKTVNGETINAALLDNTHVLADADRALEVELDAVRVTASSIKLGATPDPDQPFVRGKDFAAALGSFLDACVTLANTTRIASTTASAACVGPLAPLKAFFDGFSAALTPWQTACTVLKSKLVEGVTLSTTIVGE